MSARDVVRNTILYIYNHADNNNNNRGRANLCVGRTQDLDFAHMQLVALGGAGRRDPGACEADGRANGQAGETVLVTDSTETIMLRDLLFGMVGLDEGLERSQ